MASTPHIAFSEFFSRSDRTLIGWSAFREHVRSGARAQEAEARAEPSQSVGEGFATLSAVAGEPESAGGIWRLLALNNREVARGLRLYPSAAAAVAHVQELQANTAGLEIHLIRGPLAMQHGWYATTGGDAVMSCGRWYPAAGLCHESAAFSVEALRAARVVPDASASAAH